MSAHSHHIVSPSAMQPRAMLEDAWATEVVPQLPTDLEHEATIHRAFVRRRGIACATDLLRALLAFVLADHSTRSLGVWAVLVELADISEAAWRKRLRKSAAWLGWVLSALLTVSPVRPPRTRRRVRLIDATRIGQIRRGGDAWRVHWEYDLTAGCLGSVVVTDHHGGEHLGRFALAPGDIVVADGGYGFGAASPLRERSRLMWCCGSIRRPARWKRWTGSPLMSWHGCRRRATPIVHGVGGVAGKDSAIRCA